MSKRFIDTELFDKPFYFPLTPTQKLFWVWIVTKANMAGIIYINLKLASVALGVNVTEADIEAMGDNLHKLAPGKYIMPKFVDFQYSGMATALDVQKIKVYRGVWNCLKANGLTYPLQLATPVPPRSPFKAASKPHASRLEAAS